MIGFLKKPNYKNPRGVSPITSYSHLLKFGPTYEPPPTTTTKMSLQSFVDRNL